MTREQMERVLDGLLDPKTKGGLASYRVDEGAWAVRIQLRFRVQDLFRWRKRSRACLELHRYLHQYGAFGIVYQVVGNCWPLWLRPRLR